MLKLCAILSILQSASTVTIVLIVSSGIQHTQIASMLIIVGCIAAVINHPVLEVMGKSGLWSYAVAISGAFVVPLEIIYLITMI